MYRQQFRRQTDRQTDRQTALDILKCISALAIIAIHTSLFPLVLYPWLRLAIPIFFVTSSFLLFTKINRTAIEEEKKKILYHYLKRNAILYLFYFIALLPHTLYIRHYFENGIVSGILNMLQSILFGSSFSASWYIQATIVGTFLVFYASKKLSNQVLLVLTAGIYFFVCVCSSYLAMFDGETLMDQFFYYYGIFFRSPVFSAPSALVWIVIGKSFAEGSFVWKKKNTTIMLVCFAVILYIEWLVVKFCSGEYRNDCYFFLIPTTICIFAIVSNLKVKSIPLFTTLSKMTVITYTTHIPVSNVVCHCLKRFFSYQDGPLIFLITVLICVSGAVIIFNLEKYKYFKWLKYAH